MENFFQYDFVEGTLWFDDSLLANQSAFVSYTDKPPREVFGRKIPAKDRNIKKRMTEFLMRSRKLNESEKERCRKHMVKERMRREKQKRNYLELHSLLPSETKSDKNSIIIMAAEKVEELKRFKEELERQNSEIERVLSARKSEEMVEQAKITVRVAYPSSGVDSMLEVLKCLKQTSSKTTSIQSKFSARELSAVLGIETKVGLGAAEVEQAVHRSLLEVERKLHLYIEKAAEAESPFLSTK